MPPLLPLPLLPSPVNTETSLLAEHPNVFVTVTVVVPAATPDNIPEEFTFATEGDELVQVNGGAIEFKRG
jgi:hypothetical protein